MAPPAMIATWVKGVAQASAIAAATSATIRRGQSGARLRAIDHTASATTETAASLRPWIQPAPAMSVPAANSPNSVSTTADGSVNPTHAATPPTRPARRVPIAIPSWLLAGPGSDWQSATRLANEASSSHPRRVTYSCRKYPMCAIGPPSEVRPSLSEARSTSPTEPVRVLGWVGTIEVSSAHVGRSRPPPDDTGRARRTLGIWQWFGARPLALLGLSTGRAIVSNRTGVRYGVRRGRGHARGPDIAAPDGVAAEESATRRGLGGVAGPEPAVSESEPVRPSKIAGRTA